MSTITAVYRKTSKGEEEIANRLLNLPVKLRSLLISIDGKKDAVVLARSFSALGDIPAMIAELEQKGCIENVPAARPVMSMPPTASSAQTGGSTAHPSMEKFFYAQRFMNESAVNAYGLRSFGMTLRLEKCQHMEDLRALLPDYIKLIERGVGGTEADVLISKAKELLV